MGVTVVLPLEATHALSRLGSELEIERAKKGGPLTTVLLEAGEEVFPHNQEEIIDK